MAVVGVVAPGAMGTALGTCLAAGGHRVLTSLAGRSPATAALARPVFTDADTLDNLVAAVDVVLLVVPPGAARVAGEELGAACRRTGTRPLIVEMDAVAPATVAAIAAALPGDLVDGAISGPPPRPDAATAPGAARLVTAQAHGVLDVVLADLRLDFPDAGVAPAATAATKAWRFVDEMTEIAATQEDACLTPALFAALAEVYRDLATSAWGARRPEDVPDDGVDVDDLRSRP